MDDYDKLEDGEKYEKYPGEFIEELKDKFNSGNIDEAISRAEDHGIGIDEIVD